MANKSNTSKKTTTPKPAAPKATAAPKKQTAEMYDERKMFNSHIFEAYKIAKEIYKNAKGSGLKTSAGHLASKLYNEIIRNNWGAMTFMK